MAHTHTGSTSCAWAPGRNNCALQEVREQEIVYYPFAQSLLLSRWHRHKSNKKQEREKDVCFLGLRAAPGLITNPPFSLRARCLSFTTLYQFYYSNACCALRRRSCRLASLPLITANSPNLSANSHPFPRMPPCCFFKKHTS